MPASSVTASPVPSANTRPAGSKIVTLLLPSSLLAQFPSDMPPARKIAKTRAIRLSATASPAPEPSPAPTPPAPATANASPAPDSKVGESRAQSNSDNAADDVAAESNDAKQQGTPSPDDASKADGTAGAARPRKPALDEFGNPKPRGKPGPKKRKGIETDTTAPLSAPHKLGPKANQGAINAQLRALDRTGRASRKWQKQGFTFASFTGARWEIPQWNTPKLEFEGDVESEHTGSSDQARGENEGENEGNGSVVPSERSAHGDPVGPSTPFANGTTSAANGGGSELASSPAPPRGKEVVMST